MVAVGSIRCQVFRCSAEKEREKSISFITKLLYIGFLYTVANVKNVEMTRFTLTRVYQHLWSMWMVCIRNVQSKLLCTLLPCMKTEQIRLVDVGALTSSNPMRIMQLICLATFYEL